MVASSPERQHSGAHGLEQAPSIVAQPVKIESQMGTQLESFLEEVNRISEHAKEGPGESWQGSGGSTAIAATTSGGLSLRDQAIAAIPTPAIMQKQLERHIRSEVKKLRKQARGIAQIGKPGAAYHLNNLYARIHYLNAMLSALFEASYDVLKRLFIRVFIDRQPIL